MSGGVTEDLPFNEFDPDDNDEFCEDDANHLCAEAWTRIGGTVKSQIDYVWSTSGIRFHGGAREKLSGDHRPLVFDLEINDYGSGKHGRWREGKATKKHKILTGWKPFDHQRIMTLPVQVLQTHCCQEAFIIFQSQRNSC